MSTEIKVEINSEEQLTENNEKPPSCSNNFYKKYFPNSTKSDWQDWKWQIKNRVTNKKQLEKFITLTNNETKILDLHKENLPLSITPHYLSIFNLEDINDPIRKCVVPRIEETFIAKEEAEDPLGENHQNPVSCIVHRYPDRVLFLSTKFCSSNCRYCTRSRIVGEHQCLTSNQTEWEKGFKYIQEHTEIRDVLVSGGDPLTLTDSRLEYIISNLRKIKHVEMIRIGTKIPAVLPQRITKNLLKMLKKYHPVYMSIHFTHPNELSAETVKACNMIADAGIPMGSQTVLLKEVNDNSEIMKKLFTGLLKIRVRPYYMYQCDLIVGSSHFRTSITKGLEIIQNIRGYISGYGVPQFIIDAPNGGGKIPLLPEYVQGYDENDNLFLNNYIGKEYSYPDVFRE